MSGIERKMIELSNNSPLTQSAFNKVTTGMDDERLREFERWLDHAIRENRQREYAAKRKGMNNGMMYLH